MDEEKIGPCATAERPPLPTRRAAPAHKRHVPGPNPLLHPLSTCRPGAGSRTARPANATLKNYTCNSGPGSPAGGACAGHKMHACADASDPRLALVHPCAAGSTAHASHAALQGYAALLAMARGTSKPSAPSAWRRLPSSRGALVATMVLLAYADGSPAFAYASCTGPASSVAATAVDAYAVDTSTASHCALESGPPRMHVCQDAHACLSKASSLNELTTSSYQDVRSARQLANTLAPAQRTHEAHASSPPPPPPPPPPQRDA